VDIVGSCLDYIASNWRLLVNYGLEWIEKRKIVAYSKYSPDVFLERLTKTNEKP
jgi:hypothetical protein